uniref:Zasp-like motif domain-containing protein n=1 Tax=Anopheles culicifacies TaxID=139723 RepID=A0A182M455_9DIPT
MSPRLGNVAFSEIADDRDLPRHFSGFSVTLLLGLTLAEKKNVTEQSVEAPAAGKEKRQTEHETRSVPLSLIAARRQQALHHQQQQEYYQSEEGSFYAAQPTAGQPAIAYKSSGPAHKAANSQEQPQYQELPPEYISLLHQLAEHQPKASALKQGKAVSQQYEPQSHAQHTKPNQVQYITEEEYAQLVKQAQQQQQGPAAAHHPHHHQHQQQAQGLQAYGRPAAHGAPTASHKYRPAIQLLETAEEQQGSYGQQEGEQYRIQYKSIQQAGTVTPVPKPVSSFSFENELAKLVESNRPLAYHQVPHHPGRQHDSQHEAQRYGPTPSPQSHEYTYHSPQHPMKIVEAPQLQNEKPQKTVQSHHRSKAAEQQQVHQHRYAPREKQPESNDPHAPSRSAIFVSQSTGVNQATAAATPAPSAHGHKIPPKIDRPLTQEEFQALVDAGYSVVPVPVPVPVPISQYQQQQAAHHAAHAGAPHPGPRGGPHPTPAAVARQAAQASRYHLHQLATAENNQNQVVTYLRPLHLDPFSAGVRGPHKAAP